MTDIGLGNGGYYVDVSPQCTRIFRMLHSRALIVRGQEYFVCDVVSRVIPTDIEGKTSAPCFKTDPNVAVSREWLESSCKVSSWEDWDYAIDKAVAYYFRDPREPYDATQDDWDKHIWG